MVVSLTPVFLWRTAKFRIKYLRALLLQKYILLYSYMYRMDSGATYKLGILCG